MWGRGTVVGGRYALTERVGSGGMGEVWRAEDEVLKRPVAVKIMQPGLLEERSFSERFRREARILATLNHPGIVHVHDYGEPTEDSDEKIAYIVMEFIDGKTLNTVLAAEGPLVPARALGVIAEALDALHAAHQQDIVHRDLKPSNLMLRSDGGVTVTDFGIAQAMAGTKITTTNSVLGTALYIAPEQADGSPATPQCDLYSMGVLCFELLTGQVPFTGETVLEIVLKHMQQPAPLLAEAFPKAVREFVATSLAKDPAERFADAAAMAAAARKAAAGPGAGAVVREPTLFVTVPAPVKPEAARTAPTEPVPQQERKRSRLLLPIVIPLVISAGVGSAFLVEQAPWRSDRAAPRSSVSVTTSSPHSPAAAASSVTGAPSGSPSASSSPSAPPASAAPSGSASVPGQQPANPVPGPGGTPGGGGVNPGGGNGGTSGGSSGGGSSSGGGTTGAGGGGGGSTQQNPQPPVVNPPTSAAPPPQSGPPQGCGGSGWGYITAVGSGQRLGLGSGGLAGGTPAVVGRNTQYGWLRSAPDPGGWYSLYPCSMSKPMLVQDQSGAVELNPNWSYMTRWTVRSASTQGASYLEDYMGSTCLTDNGTGNAATMTTCTPGNSAQEWYIP